MVQIIALESLKEKVQYKVLSVSPVELSYAMNYVFRMCDMSVSWRKQFAVHWSTWTPPQSKIVLGTTLSAIMWNGPFSDEQHGPDEQRTVYKYLFVSDSYPGFQGYQWCHTRVVMVATEVEKDLGLWGMHLKLKDWLSIKHIIWLSTTRWQHSCRWNWCWVWCKSTEVTSERQCGVAHECHGNPLNSKHITGVFVCVCVCMCVCVCV